MALELSRFVAPRDLYLDRGTLGHLRSSSGHRAAIFCGNSSLAQSGELVRAQGLLQSAGLESKTFSGIVGELGIDAIRDLGKQLEEWSPDWLVAIGGGSVLNAAKAAWVAYEHPQFPFTEKDRRPLQLRRKAPSMVGETIS